MYLLLFLWPSRAYTEAPASYEVGCIFKNKLVGDPQVRAYFGSEENAYRKFQERMENKSHFSFFDPQPTTIIAAPVIASNCSHLTFSSFNLYRNGVHAVMSAELWLMVEKFCW